VAEEVGAVVGKVGAWWTSTRRSTLARERQVPLQ